VGKESKRKKGLAVPAVPQQDLKKAISAVRAIENRAQRKKGIGSQTENNQPLSPGRGSSINAEKGGTGTETAVWRDKYEESRYELMESRLNERNTASFSSFRSEINDDWTKHKSEMWRWSIGIIVTIILGLIVFHFSSLDNIKKETKNSMTDAIQNAIKPINESINKTSSRIDRIEKKLNIK